MPGMMGNQHPPTQRIKPPLHAAAAAAAQQWHHVPFLLWILLTLSSSAATAHAAPYMSSSVLHPRQQPETKCTFPPEQGKPYLLVNDRTKKCVMAATPRSMPPARRGLMVVTSSDKVRRQQQQQRPDGGDRSPGGKGGGDGRGPPGDGKGQGGAVKAQGDGKGPGGDGRGGPPTGGGVDIYSKSKDPRVAITVVVDPKTGQKVAFDCSKSKGDQKISSAESPVPQPQQQKRPAPPPTTTTTTRAADPNNPVDIIMADCNFNDEAQHVIFTQFAADPLQFRVSVGFPNSRKCIKVAKGAPIDSGTVNAVFNPDCGPGIANMRWAIGGSPNATLSQIRNVETVPESCLFSRTEQGSADVAGVALCRNVQDRSAWSLRAPGCQSAPPPPPPPPAPKTQAPQPQKTPAPKTETVAAPSPLPLPSSSIPVPSPTPTPTSSSTSTSSSPSSTTPTPNPTSQIPSSEPESSSSTTTSTPDPPTITNEQPASKKSPKSRPTLDVGQTRPPLTNDLPPDAVIVPLAAAGAASSSSSLFQKLTSGDINPVSIDNARSTFLTTHIAAAMILGPILGLGVTLSAVAVGKKVSGGQ
ncbi:hypothetical protein DFS34DRAFT_325888 [Phlyctochytrium arcticum]|nr:hypothetical protein DFS34DRAFT_325888 [Phlyctochytrium arcticum]